MQWNHRRHEWLSPDSRCQDTNTTSHGVLLCTSFPFTSSFYFPAWCFSFLSRRKTEICLFLIIFFLLAKHAFGVFMKSTMWYNYQSGFGLTQTHTWQQCNKTAKYNLMLETKTNKKTPQKNICQIKFRLMSNVLMYSPIKKKNLQSCVFRLCPRIIRSDQAHTQPGRRL